MRRKWLFVLVALSIVLLVSGCGNGGTAATGAAKDTGGVEKAAVKENTEPVTLTLFMNNLISDADLERELYEPLKKKYPYITVEATMNGGENKIENLITAGTPPDLFNYYVGAMGNIIKLGLVEDITPMLKKNKIDLSRFQQVMIDSVRAASDKGELYGLPRYSNTVALYYNKDIFDKFGVPYPKDGLNWDQTLEIAKKVSRSDGGVNYYGLSGDSLYRPSFIYSLSPVDPKTNKASINNDHWRKVLELDRNIFSIPGNLPDPISLVNSGVKRFTETRDLAMLASVNNLRQIEPAAAKGFNWDLAQYPFFPDKPNVGGMVDVHVIGVSKTSKHKDAAMKVVELMTSDEVQLIAARQSAAASPLNNKEMQKQFGAEAPYLKGKNVQAFFKSKAAPAPQFSLYLNDAKKVFTPMFTDYVAGKSDLNTFIREAEDAINKKMEDVVGK
ncbi:MAG: transporter substrate-binding protein [Paenibacillaceae bacterium]|nr:transporter substrate-binding protein [Paenibacillaceae bacterium]